MKQREITEEWVQWAIFNPDLIIMDKLRSEIIYFYKKIPSANQKILQVVTKKINSKDDYLIITCYFDKKMRNKL